MAKSELVDEEILQYFQHLSNQQKQAVLAIAGLLLLGSRIAGIKFES